LHDREEGTEKVNLNSGRSSNRGQDNELNNASTEKEIHPLKKKIDKYDLF
jgi:hypothetical protein